MLVQHAPLSHPTTILEIRVPQHQTLDKAYLELTFQWQVQLIFRNTPFKASFLLWRSLNGKLPTSEKLKFFCLEPSSCFYCRNMAGSDTINHIFSNAEFPREVRRYFANTVLLEVDHS